MQVERFVAIWLQKITEKRHTILWWRCIVQFESFVATLLQTINENERYMFMMKMYHAIWNCVAIWPQKINSKERYIFMKMYRAIWKLCGHMATPEIKESGTRLWWTRIMQFESFVAIWLQTDKFEKGATFLGWICDMQVESFVAIWQHKINRQERYIFMLHRYHAIWKVCSHVGTTNRIGGTLLWWSCTMQLESFVAIWQDNINRKERSVFMMSMYHAIWKLCSHNIAATNN